MPVLPSMLPLSQNIRPGRRDDATVRMGGAAKGSNSTRQWLSAAAGGPSGVEFDDPWDEPIYAVAERIFWTRVEKYGAATACMNDSERGPVTHMRRGW